MVICLSAGEGPVERWNSGNGLAGKEEVGEQRISVVLGLLEVLEDRKMVGRSRWCF